MNIKEVLTFFFCLFPGQDYPEVPFPFDDDYFY